MIYRHDHLTPLVLMFFVSLSDKVVWGVGSTCDEEMADSCTAGVCPPGCKADITALIETCDNCEEITYVCDGDIQIAEVLDTVLPDVPMSFTAYAYFDMASSGYDWDTGGYYSQSDGGNQGGASYWNSYGPFDDTSESNCGVSEENESYLVIEIRLTLTNISSISCRFQAIFESVMSTYFTEADEAYRVEGGQDLAGNTEYQACTFNIDDAWNNNTGYTKVKYTVNGNPDSFRDAQTPTDFQNKVSDVLKAAFKDTIISNAIGHGTVGSGWTCIMRTTDSEEGSNAGEIEADASSLPLSVLPPSFKWQAPCRNP